ncbi:dimethylarginine dimethylaminohydrolase family protein [Evansella tamaricis]|uniref:Dimethylarginine dimethylaminohydrolase family protein n=1 Tax=Evansella tamaricis TaxID=2069301 RepID=A0ABS6JJ16_9BACI|nr:dimethylarginine dimethylaminohydrolase family protein [Evansella tamaricis]MBU9713638.1 dimethylarginine dimethylaminohydrolase family protein [Evansella tamaricis]
MYSAKQIEKSYCASEYDKLERVILCEPKYMTIREQINETQKHFKNEGLHIEKAMEQHKNFVNTLQSQDIDVILLPSLEKFPEQVFTRDIGFTLGQTIFVADMANEIRQGEEEELKRWLKQEQISYFNLVGDMIEGGDVIIDRENIFIGLSNRTNQFAIDHVQSLLHQFNVITVPFTEKYLHLDCVFNIISPTEALFFPEAFTKKEIDVLQSYYELIPVSKEEQFTLGTNILSIGNKKIISLPVNKDVNNQLKKRGFEVIEVDISEIIKSGGSFRCCTLPLKREITE